MQLKLDSYLSAVARTVSAQERDGKALRGVTLERRYATSAEDLWDAVTDPRRLSRWFVPVTVERRIGGRYRFEDNAEGTIVECDPPHLLSVTWEFSGLSWLEVRIAAEGDTAARLNLSHIGPVDDHWQKFGAGAAGVGWDLSLVALAAHIAGIDFDQDAQNAFLSSSEGKAHIAQWSDDWRRAAVEGGEDPTEAHDAARRTTAFYTGEDA